VRFLTVAVDGVLADTLPARVAALQAAAESLGVTLALPLTDATRHTTGPLLEHLLSETNASRAIAADDVRTTGADLSMLQRQYALIAPSIHGAREVCAVEASAHARDTVLAMMPELHMDWPTL
jgi:hypothetical protein